VAITMAVKEASTAAEGSGGFGPAAAGGKAGRVVPPGASRAAEGSGGFGPAAAGGKAGRVVPPGASRARASARERLLAAANELFYNEGVHTVGIDRIIEQAGVAKASLYNTFGSKDELVRAYLQTRQASVAQRIMQAVERYATPRERLLAVFEGQGELFAQPDYRGCAFARASAESHPGDLAEQAAEGYRRWVRALLTELAAQAGVPEPEVLARQLHLLYDGSGQSARMDHDSGAAAAARAAAAILLDAALARGTTAPSAELV
jgi:AcrR family transcriptional regulator